MGLLEVVAGSESSPEAVTAARAAGERMGKKVIIARDGPGFLATVHLLAAQPAPSVLERMHLRLGATLYPGLTDAVDGRIAVPTDPGLGPEPDPSVIARYRVV